MPDEPAGDAAPGAPLDTPARGIRMALVDGPKAAGRRRGIKRTIQIVLFWLVFNNLILPQLGGFRSALDTLSELNPVLLVLGLGFQLAAFAAYSRLTWVALPSDDKLKLFRLVRIQLATKTVTNLVPGGSAAGSALGFRLMTASGVEPANAGFALATVGVGSAVVLNLMLWLALLWTIPFQGVNAAYATVGIIGILLMAAFGLIVIGLLKGRAQAERAVRAVARKVRFVKEDKAVELVSSIADRLRDMMRDPVLLRRAALWAVANWLLDAASLYVFLRAFGGQPPIDGILLAFCLANVSAAIPITPGGLGVVEAVLTSTLVAFGMEPSTAAIGVVTYRLAAFWLPIPLGAISYVTLRLGPRDRTAAFEAIGTAPNRLEWIEQYGHLEEPATGLSNAGAAGDEEKPGR